MEALEVAAVAVLLVLDQVDLVLTEEAEAMEPLVMLVEAEAEWLLPTEQQELIKEMVQEGLVKPVL